MDYDSFIELFAPSSETVCEFGDVILVADDGFHPIIKIRVSSCILAGASKGFKVLFSKRFAEGHTMRTHPRKPVLLRSRSKTYLRRFCCFVNFSICKTSSTPSALPKLDLGA